MGKEKKCDRCSLKSKILLPYGPHYFCERHFLEFFEKRVRKTIRKFRLFSKGERIVVGVSGGKDSLTALYLLDKFYSSTNEIHALMLDEGIPKYRDKALEIAKKNCKEWNIPFTVVSFRKRFGITMLEIMKKIKKKKELGSACSFCGPMRRNLLNEVSKGLKADKLVTGHNLDDETQSIVMNLFDNDLVRMARLGPKAGIKSFKQFIPRIKPLYECPETEIIAYADFKGIKHYREECCPFSWQAKRNSFRKMLNEFEAKFPGTKHSILKTFLQIKPLMEKKFIEWKVKECIECGAPTGGRVCKTCIQLKKLF